MCFRITICRKYNSTETNRIYLTNQKYVLLNKINRVHFGSLDLLRNAIRTRSVCMKRRTDISGPRMPSPN